MASRICIVATVREPVAIIESFIRYHLAIGVERLFLFFDDPLDEAIGLAWQMRMDWIIHIDGDELLFGATPVSQFFDCVPHAIGQMSFRNFEGVPETWDIGNYFREVTLFKRHDHLLPPSWSHKYRLFRSRENYLLGYGNGKSAARVVPELLPSGVHCFSTTKAHPQRIDCPESLVILHYINCGFDAYLRKYQRLGSDSWLGTPIPFKFYIDSRRLAADTPALTNLYRHEALFDDPNETEYLLGQRILARIVVPSNLLAE